MTVPVAGRTVIELGARASVLEVVERIAAAPAADELVLSLSAGAPAARNAVFFEVARRAAGTRRLAIVSPDARARSLASSVHLPAFASTAALERQELDVTEPLTTARRAALARTVRVKQPAGASPATALGILGSLLAAALVFMVVIGPTATVVVAPVSKALGPIEFDLRAGPDGEIDALTLVANDLTQTYAHKATGERLEPIKAKGVVRFTNKDTRETRVAKGTIVRTRDNVRFQTTEEKVIPRSSLDIIPPFVKFGTVDIAVEALDAGPAGNVASNTIIVTDRPEEFAVSNPQATSGGEIKKFAVITGSDYGLAAGRAEEELRKRADQKVGEWRKSVESGRVVYGPVTKVTGVTASAGLVGTEPSNKEGVFEMTVTGTATAYTVPATEPRATTITKLRERAEPQNDINEAAAVVDVIIEPTLVENGVRWRVRAHTSQFPQVRDDPLRASLAGREFAEAETVVNDQGLHLVRLEIWPGWWPRLPFFDSRLRIQVETETSANATSP
jgi:hypothetical protein